MLGDLKACAAPRCSKLCRWLGTQAEELGVDIYPGFAASELLLKGGAAAGVATNDFGVAKDGTRKPTFQRGLELQARATLLAEGCRGSLSEVGPCMLVQTYKISCRYYLRKLTGGGPMHACCISHIKVQVFPQEAHQRWGMHAHCMSNIQPQILRAGLKAASELPEQRAAGEACQSVSTLPPLAWWSCSFKWCCTSCAWLKAAAAECSLRWTASCCSQRPALLAGARSAVCRPRCQLRAAVGACRG